MEQKIYSILENEFLTNSEKLEYIRLIIEREKSAARLEGIDIAFEALRGKK